jgi:hypothetical protein
LKVQSRLDLFHDHLEFENDGFLPQSSSRESVLSYQITIDNPQKDNFHNPIFDVDKILPFCIFDSTIQISFLFPKGLLMEKDL